MVSCTGSRYSSDDVLEDIKVNKIDSVAIILYSSSIFSDTATSYSTSVYEKIIDSTIVVPFSESDSLMNDEIVYFLNSVPDSKSKLFARETLINFKKAILKNKGIDSLNIDSIYNMPRELRKKRNIISNSYFIKLYSDQFDAESMSFYSGEDNVVSYTFCCTDDDKWIYKKTKNYTAYSEQYILDIEFQKRFVNLFNDILTKYNETNGTDYPLLDVDYEVWSGIISAP